MQEVGNRAFFAGTFTHRIDKKGRISIPARWRSEFRAEESPPSVRRGAGHRQSSPRDRVRDAVGPASAQLRAGRPHGTVPAPAWSARSSPLPRLFRPADRPGRPRPAARRCTRRGRPGGGQGRGNSQDPQLHHAVADLLNSSAPATASTSSIRTTSTTSWQRPQPKPRRSIADRGPGTRNAGTWALAFPPSNMAVKLWPTCRFSSPKS